MVSAPSNRRRSSDWRSLSSSNRSCAHSRPLKPGLLFCCCCSGGLGRGRSRRASAPLGNVTAWTRCVHYAQCSHCYAVRQSKLDQNVTIEICGWHGRVTQTRVDVVGPVSNLLWMTVHVLYMHACSCTSYVHILDTWKVHWHWPDK